jgi:hypothetical protein
VHGLCCYGSRLWQCTIQTIPHKRDCLKIKSQTRKVQDPEARICERMAKRAGCSPRRMFPISKQSSLSPTKRCSSRCNKRQKPTKESRLRLKRFADPDPPYPRILQPLLHHQPWSPRTELPISSRHPHLTNGARRLTWMTLASRSVSQAGTPTPMASAPQSPASYVALMPIVAGVVIATGVNHHRKISYFSETPSFR